jgi:fibronectin-binding autotransporter adhesin
MKTQSVNSFISKLHRLVVLSAVVFATRVALADNELWVGIPGTSATTNWSDPLNFSGTSHNPNNNNVYFINNGPTIVGTVDSVVDTSTNCLTLNFTNAATTHTTLIQPGQTLTIDGNSGISAGTLAALNVIPLGQVTTTNTITGANGTLLITGAAAGGVNVNSTNTSATGFAPVLDLSGLGTFIISNTAATASMWIGSGAVRSDGILNLAMTNYLSLPTNGIGNAAALIVGDNTSDNGNNPGGILNLGITNQIFADNIGIGLSKETPALLRFNPVFTNGGANPVVYIRGFSTTAVKRWAIGDGLGQSGTVNGAGTVNLNSGTVNAVVTALVLGRPTSVSAASGTPSAAGTLSFNTGSISVVNLTNGLMTIVAGVGSTPTNSTDSGTINITGTGTLTANNVVMAILLGTGGASSGSINITNGTLAVGTMAVGTGHSTNNLNGGTFIVTNTVGTPALPLTALNLTGGTLQFSLNGSGSIATNISTTGVGTNGAPTTISIASVANVSTTKTFPLIGYSTGNDPFGNLTLATPLPNDFTATLADDAGEIDLIVNPPAAAASLIWVGATNSILVSNWDDVSSNWLDAATFSIPSVYADLDSVQFDDTASNNIVTLITNMIPFAVVVTNNARNYTFNGAGKITGITSLVKNGSGSLTLAESGGDSFNGGVIVSNGTVVLDNAGSSISGGLNIVNGTAQLGNNDANGNVPGTVTDNGSLIFDRTDLLTVGNIISGGGAVTQNGSDTLTLTGNNNFGGGLTVNAGTLRLGSSTAQGTGTLTVNNTGTLVLGVTNLANTIVLSGGTLGESGSINPLTNNLTATAGTTSIIYEADPQNLTPGDASEMAWSNTLSGSGSIIVATVTNDASADSGNGFRLRGIAPTTFSGTIIFSNNVKGELQTTVAGPFSPAGTGTIGLLCGTYLGNNSTTNQVTGIDNGYTELNLRNQSSGNAAFGNNVVILGSGFTTLDPLGTAPAGASVTMGNLTVGNGQEVGVYLSAAPTHVIVFPTVTLTGGTVRFSPKTPGFGAVTSVGADLTFGSVSESSPSSIVMNGELTLTFIGNSTYSGSTTISNGTLEVDGAVLGTGAVTVEAGATLDGTGLLAGPVTVAADGTLAPGNAVTTTNATLSISNTLTLAGTNIMDMNKTGSVFTGDLITNITTVTYGGTLQLNLTGAALVAGDAFKLYSCSSGTGAFGTIIPSIPGVGLLWNTNTLATGVLSVIPAVNTNPTNITTVLNGSTLTLSWPVDHTGWHLQIQTNSLATGIYTNWVTLPGSNLTNTNIFTIDPANGTVFYRMIYP